MESNYAYAAIAICLILVVFLIVKENQRKNKARLIWRIMASIVAVSCFALMIVPLHYSMRAKNRTNEMTLLTSGTSPDSIARLKGIRLYTMDSLLKADNGSQVETIADLAYFLKSHPDIKTIHVYGYGLTEPQLKDLKAYQLDFHPSPLPEGFLSCTWNSQVSTTSALIVQGTYNNKSDKAVRLLLSGFGSDLDSTVVKAHKKAQFSLRNQPKQAGKAVYQLVASQEQDTISKEPVPFEVIEVPRMKVMMLASYPDFEYKFLKNWLYENQYPLIFRSRISKDKYNTEYLNAGTVNLSQLSKALLKKIDVLIIDEEELTYLSASEMRNLNQSVESGMGLLVRKTDLDVKTALGKRFLFYSSQSREDKETIVRLINQEKFAALPLKQDIYLKSKPNDQPLAIDAGGKIVVNSHILGQGKIVMSVVPATYQWILSGKQSNYATFWSALLTKAARNTSKPNSWQMIPSFPVAGSKTQLFVTQNNPDKIPNLLITANETSLNNPASYVNKLSPRQNLELPFQWDATFWPEKNGWNTLSINREINSFFVYKSDNWRQLKNYNTLISTKNYNKRSGLNNKITTKTSYDTKIISKWWFYIGFLISAGFLWYESRVLSKNN
ncbi:putative membrane protein [Arcticibacter svalbardensis MN12-7]|uniref:Putative membrane protein n=1 Tax=Arcticibacter svalbardensis MN12-7 TaxID=1150600 RepID=R9GWD0_9SPHI|nr:hypothetical protein [Arcticibacter svalbardensis]EOR96117.1 putative membrane protein [Arcticibacter svalbardensis MN12-7]